MSQKIETGLNFVHKDLTEAFVSKFEIETSSAIRDFASLNRSKDHKQIIYCVCHSGEILRIIPESQKMNILCNFDWSLRSIELFYSDNEFRLIVGGESGAVFLDLEGNVLWRYTPNEIVRGVGVIPLDKEEPQFLIADNDQLLLLDQEYRIIRKYKANQALYSLQVVKVANQQMELVYGTREGSIEWLDSDFRLKWSFKVGNFVRAVCASDFNQDGVFEVVAGDVSKKVYIISSSGKKLAKDLKVSDRIQSIFIGDVDCDGKQEILVGTRDRIIHVFDCDRGELLWKCRTQDWPSQIKALDYSEKGIQSIGVSTGRGFTILKANSLNKRMDQIKEAWLNSSQDERKQFMLKLTKHERIILTTVLDDWVISDPRLSIVWECQMEDRVRAILPIEYKKIGMRRVLVGTEGGLFMLEESEDGVHRKTKILQKAIRRIRQYRIEDPNSSYIVGTSDGEIYEVNVHDENSEYSIIFNMNRAITAIYTEDVDQDGEIEILVSSEDLDFYVLKRERVKFCYHTSMWIRTLSANDVDADGSFEILVGTEDKYLDIISLDGKLKRRFMVKGGDQRWIWDTAIAGQINRSSARIIASANNRKIYSICGKTCELEWSYKTNERVHSVIVSENLMNPGSYLVVAGSSEGLTLLTERGDLIEIFDTGRVASFWVEHQIDPNSFDVIVAVHGNKLYRLSASCTCKALVD